MQIDLQTHDFLLTTLKRIVLTVLFFATFPWPEITTKKETTPC